LTKEWEKTAAAHSSCSRKARNHRARHGGNADQHQQPLLLDLAEQVQALKLQSQAPAREVSLSGSW